MNCNVQCNALCASATAHMREMWIFANRQARIIDLSRDWHFVHWVVAISLAASFFEVTSSMCPTRTDEVSRWHFNDQCDKLLPLLRLQEHQLKHQTFLSIRRMSQIEKWQHLRQAHWPSQSMRTTKLLALTWCFGNLTAMLKLAVCLVWHFPLGFSLPYQRKQ